MKVEILLVGASVVTPHGSLTTSTVTLVDHPSGPILIDTAAWNQRAVLTSELARRSIQPNDIRCVILTHLHWDHCMNVDLFERADVIVSRGEWARVDGSALDRATPAYIRTLLEQHGRLRLVTDGEFMDGISILPTPGHTSGHISIVLGSDAGVVVSGDALPSRVTADAGVPPLIFGDELSARRSVSAILAAGHLIVPGHDSPFHPAGGSLIVDV